MPAIIVVLTHPCLFFPPCRMFHLCALQWRRNGHPDLTCGSTNFTSSASMPTSTKAFAWTSTCNFATGLKPRLTLCSKPPGLIAANACHAGFCPAYCDEVLEVKFTKAKREALRRSLAFYARRKAIGAITRLALRGDRKIGSFRGNGGRSNAKKSPEMTFFMLQYFVDFVQNLYVRTDASLMMRHARRLRLILLQVCCDDNQSPKIVGNVGARWFRRWRHECGIIYKTSGMQLKAPWSKILKRVRVLLENIVRVRAFWEWCFPGKRLGVYLPGPEALLV